MERHLVVGRRHQITPFVHHFHKDMGHRVRRQLQGAGSARRHQFTGGTVVRLAAQRAGLPGHTPRQHARSLVAHGPAAHFAAVDRQAGVLAVGDAHHVDAVALLPVPAAGGVDVGPLVAAVAVASGAGEAAPGADVAYGLLAPQRGAIPSRGLAPSGQIQQTGRRTACGPRAALAQIVDARPEELPEDVFVVRHRLPRGQVVAVFRTVDDTLGVGLMIRGVAALGVVVAHHVHGGGIGRGVGHHDAGQRTRCGTRGVDVLNNLGQTLRDEADALGVGLLGLVAAVSRLGELLPVAVEHGVRIGIVGIVHLVADAPHEDRGVTAVAAHHVGHVAVDPVLKIGIGTLKLGGAGVPSLHPFALGELPFVRGLVHHQQSHLVAQVVELGGVGVVAHAQGVHADVLQLGQTAAPHLLRHGHTQHAGVVVHADAFHLHPLAVEGETFVGRELQRAQSGPHRRGVVVLGLGGEQHGAQRVEIGALQRPALRVLHRQPHGFLLVAADGGFGRRHRLAVPVDEFHPGAIAFGYRFSVIGYRI